MFNSVASIDNDNKPHTDRTRPYVQIKILDMVITGLLDTGSSVTILGNDSHKKLLSMGLQLNTTNHVQFSTAGGEEFNSLGTISLPIDFLHKKHIMQAYVVPGIKHPLILGIDFWKLFDLFPKHLDAISFCKDTNSTLKAEAISESSLCSYEHLPDDQRATADQLISQFRDISYEERGLGRTSLITHKIDTGDAAPIRQRYYRMSPEKQRVLVEQLDEMLKDDVVEPCESPWSSPVLLTPKKSGELRFCLDSRKLNSITKKDAYSLPYVSEILDNLRDAKYLSSIDLSKSFWQINIQEEDRCKTAFYIPSRGTFQFKSMPFGLTNAPATQQRLVDFLFYGPEFEHKVFVFVDDVIIVSESFEQHISLLKRVLNKLKMANLTINLKKSQFFRTQLKYLGYVIDVNGLHADDDKVASITNYPTPANRKEVRRFLGTASWYRRFIPNFSNLASPLNKLTSQGKKAPPFVWTQEADDAFKKLKVLLSSAPILSCPDYTKPFEVHTDASDHGLGAVLTQKFDDTENVIAYMSKSLTKQERNYSATEREALAVLTAIEHWRCYLENGQKFTVYTDHSSLKWFLNLNNPTGRLARWGVRLSAFNFEIKHRKGTENVVPDSLSRAVPVAAINQSTVSQSKPLLNTNDPWYLNLYNGCLNSPTSFLNYQVSNGKLYRYMKSLNPLTREFEWKEVVPLEHRHTIISQNHCEATSGHFGIFKTHKRLALKHFWPSMHRDVSNFISNCDTCNSYKYPNHATLGTMGRPKDCSRPFQMISIDLVGPLPVSRKQNTFLLVVHCCFSKYSLLFPIRRATAEVISKIIEENVFLIHGIPSTVLMDNGRQFISNTMKKLFQYYNIPNIFYTPLYTPQINSVERYNKTIITAVSALIENDHRSWDIYIPKIQFAMNSAVNEVTGYTPSFLVFGRELVTCGSHYVDADIVDEIIFNSRDAYVENLGCLGKSFDKVQLALIKAHSRNCTTYNLRRKDIDFNVGDIVWKRTFYQSDKDNKFTKKLAPKFIKCRIVNKKSKLVYELEDMSGNRLGAWHVKDFKLH